MLPVKRILHPTDFSECSDAAFHLACSLARDYSARLLVLHVAVPPAIVYGEGVVPPVPPESPDSLRERLRRLCPRDPKVEAEHRLLEGEAADEILRAAGEANADVIVMGTQGRTGLSRLLMGSVAEQVLRRATCPVVTVKSTPAKTSAAGAAPEAAGRAAGVARG
jgi:nucleotide-binding universal stress UspA family protein